MPINFFAPDGGDCEGITAERVADLILNRGAEFWEAGSGDAAIRFADDQADGEITLMLREPLGVFVQYTDLRSGAESVLTNGNSTLEIVTIVQGGEPWELPRAFFVPRSMAVKAIRDFMRTRKRPDKFIWSDF